MLHFLAAASAQNCGGGGRHMLLSIADHMDYHFSFSPSLPLLQLDQLLSFNNV